MFDAKAARFSPQACTPGQISVEWYEARGQVHPARRTRPPFRHRRDRFYWVDPGFTPTEWDTSKPHGTPQKLLDVSKLARAGWASRITLESGLRSTVRWHHEHRDTLRE